MMKLLKSFGLHWSKIKFAWQIFMYISSFHELHQEISEVNLPSIFCMDEQYDISVMCEFHVPHPEHKWQYRASKPETNP